MDIKKQLRNIKSGDKELPDNYRGIALTSIFNKVFAQMLNDRLQEWADEHRLIREEQAGFRKGYSTVDNIFVLCAIIRKQLAVRKKLYLGFVKFKSNL